MENRIARRFFLVAAMLGISSVSTGQEPAPAVRLVNPASIRAQQLTPGQLADLVAPIALYPDALLSQVLVASTYPLEVVQAQQWLQRNERLQGQALMDAARQQPWDASVQGLVAFPDALAMLNQDIQWTTDLGNAFLAQESDVMVAVQQLRGQAQAAGRLSSTPQQTVSAVAEEGRTVIEIVPADPQVIYVPRYDPYYVWGSPAWGAYPPLSYGYGYGFGLGIDVGFWFGGWSWGLGWGWGPNWYGGSVYVNNAFFRHCGYDYGHHGGYYGGGHGGHKGGRDGGYPAGGHAGRETWQHDGSHRMGVPYSNSRVAARHDAASRASRSTMTSGGSFPRSGNVTASPSGDRLANPGARGGATDQAWRSGSRTMTQGSRGGGPDQGWRTPGEQPRRSQASAQGQSPSTRSLDSAPRISAASPRSFATSPRTLATSPRSSTASPRSYDTSPRSSAASPRSPAASPRSFSTSPRTLATSPRHSGSTPGYSAPSPRSSAASPRSFATSPRTLATSPRHSGSTPGYSAPSPRGSASSPRFSGSSPGYSSPSRSYSSSSPTRGYQPAPRSYSSSGAARSPGGGSSQRSGGGGGGSRGAAGGSGSGGGSRGGGRRH